MGWDGMGLSSWHISLWLVLADSPCFSVFNKNIIDVVLHWAKVTIHWDTIPRPNDIYEDRRQKY